MSDDDNVVNNHKPSIETSPNVVNDIPNNEINNALDLNGKQFFSFSFPSIE